jgi:hypothetical protein
MTRKAQLMWLAGRPTASSPCPHQGRFENEPPVSLM